MTMNRREVLLSACVDGLDSIRSPQGRDESPLFVPILVQPLEASSHRSEPPPAANFAHHPSMRFVGARRAGQGRASAERSEGLLDAHEHVDSLHRVMGDDHYAAFLCSFPWSTNFVSAHQMKPASSRATAMLTTVERFPRSSIAFRFFTNRD